MEDFTLLAVDDAGNTSEMSIPQRGSLKEAEHVARDIILSYQTGWVVAVVFGDDMMARLRQNDTLGLGRFLLATPPDWNLVR